MAHNLEHKEAMTKVQNQEELNSKKMAELKERERLLALGQDDICKQAARQVGR